MLPISFEALNWLVGFGAVMLEIGALALFALLFLRKRGGTAAELSALVYRFGLVAGLVLTLGALAMSLYYSEVLGFIPCSLCWLMRIFMYSQVFIFATALVKKDRSIADYIIVLSAAGLLVGLYQHYLQLGGGSFLPCPADQAEADCAERIIFEFGHVTFPWVGVSMFLFLIATALHLRAGEKERG